MIQQEEQEWYDYLLDEPNQRLTEFNDMVEHEIAYSRQSEEDLNDEILTEEDWLPF